MIKKSKILVIVLVIIMLTAVFVGCKDKNTITSKGQNTTTITYESAIENINSYKDSIAINDYSDEMVKRMRDDAGYTGLEHLIIGNPGVDSGFEVIFIDTEENAKTVQKNMQSLVDENEKEGIVVKVERFRNVIVAAIGMSIEDAVKYLTEKNSEK